MDEKVAVTNPLDRELYDAASWGDYVKVQCLLSNEEINVNCQNSIGNTPLYIACAWGHKNTQYRHSDYFEIIKLLIRHGADINLANDLGKTPLWIAASWGHSHVVSLLIILGADINAKALESNLTPLYIAVYTQRMNHYTIFAKHHAYHLAKAYMEMAMKTGEYLRILTEIEHDYKVLMTYSAENPEENIPYNIMQIVIRYNHFATVKELLHAGAEICLIDSQGSTPLNKEMLCGHVAMANLLVENGFKFI